MSDLLPLWRLEFFHLAGMYVTTSILWKFQPSAISDSYVLSAVIVPDKNTLP